jgi:hypothetical protein
MGTRAITILKDDDREIAVLYRQFDGYPDAMGADIVKALGGGREVVNGYNSPSQINGGNDMAVQLIAWMKHDATVGSTYNPQSINSTGGLYLYPAGTHDCGQAYTYTITCVRPERDVPGKLLVSCEGYGEKDSFKDRTDAIASGLVIVYGASDDIMEFVGAIDDECGCCDGGTALVDKHGVLDRSRVDDEDLHGMWEHVTREKSARKITAVWAEDGYSWTYRTDIPHATFEITEDGEPYCRGIVFALADLAVAE